MVAAIGSAAHAREKVHAPAAQVADDELGLYQYFSTIVPARYCARESSPPADMQQASAAYSNVEAEVLALQVALKNRMAEPSVERDSDSEQASHSPCSSYGGDCLDENWHAAFDGGMDATCQLYDAANVHYTRQQVRQFNWHVCIVCMGHVRELQSLAYVARLFACALSLAALCRV